MNTKERIIVGSNNGPLSEEQINTILKDLNFRRWAKHDRDRLYLDSKSYGVFVHNIVRSTGFHHVYCAGMSNTKAREAFAKMEGAKAYIDCVTGDAVIEKWTDEYGWSPVPEVISYLESALDGAKQ